MRGFLVLEIAAGLFFVSLALLTLATWFAYTSNVQTAAVNRLRALVYATSLLEQCYAHYPVKMGTYSYDHYTVTVERKKDSKLPDLDICTVHVQWQENKQRATLELETGMSRA